MLDQIRFRQLVNGFTIRYHVADHPHSTGSDQQGFSKEVYVASKEGLAKMVQLLIEENL